MSRLPERLATGAYILHSGLEKWNGSPEQAIGIHGMASGAYPFLAKIKPATFLNSPTTPIRECASNSPSAWANGMTRAPPRLWSSSAVIRASRLR